MIIGIDFDNTIACYDNIFYQEAINKNLIDDKCGTSKNSVRDFLRAQGREDKWTELQGHVYGCAMDQVKPYPGFIEFLKKAFERNVKVLIISHKTEYSKLGPRYNLHHSALKWLEGNRITGIPTYGISLPDIHFAPTREEKIKLIAKCECTHYIDDLPEVFYEQNFPENVIKILFSGTIENPCRAADHTFITWNQITNFIFPE